MILLDTVVLSELRKRDTSPQVIHWLTGYQDSDLFLSVVSIGEIERGIEKKRTTDPAFATLLTQWIEDLLRLYGDRILPVTSAIARRWGNFP
jgi:predicted nucleic acid-binding protein